APSASDDLGERENCRSQRGRKGVESGKEIHHTVGWIRREELVSPQPAERNCHVSPRDAGYEVRLDEGLAGLVVSGQRIGELRRSLSGRHHILRMACVQRRCDTPGYRPLIDRRILESYCECS